MERTDLTLALEQIDVERYLDAAGVEFKHSYGTRGLQLNLDECPVCGEGGRKTYINAETGLGNCFHGSCGFKFNKFKLIQRISGLSGRELFSHIEFQAESQGWMPKVARKEIKFGTLELPSKLRPIPEGGRHLNYLAQRDISADSALYFQLSYCDKGWWKFQTTEGEKFVSYDKRIIIPISNLEGNLVSFQGRDITGTKLPKYLFPTGFAVTGKHLYNAQNFIKDRHTHLIVGEGAFDAIAIHQALQGHSSCVTMLPIATFGMHLSAGPDSQIDKLITLAGKGVKTVTMMWDSEPAAMEAAIKAGLTMIGLGFKVQIAQLPDGMDPNEATAEQVRQAIFKATPLSQATAVKLLYRAKAIVA